MSDTRDILRRGLVDLPPDPDAYDHVVRRLERHRRNQRLAAGVVAAAVVLIASLAFLAALRTDPVPVDPPPVIEPRTTGLIAFSDHDDASQDDQIFVVESDGSDRVQLTSGPRSDYPVWSPDATKIAFVRGGDALFTMNADGSGQTRVVGPIPGLDLVYQPSWSPDGTQLVFGAAGEAGYEVHVVNVDGSGLTKISRDREEDFWPSWSPDGNLIAFRTGRGRALATMSPDGSNKTILVPGGIDYPTWSPDGQIQFIQHQSGSGWDVFRINTDGTDLTQLTDSDEMELFPVPSSDGTQIAYRSDGYIYTASIDGNGRPVRVTGVTWTESPLNWQPT